MQVLMKGSRKHEIFSVNDLAFSPDGVHLAAALGYMEKGTNRWEGKVLIWRLASDGSPITVHQCRNTVRLVAFSPDGQYLAAPSGDWSIRVWKVGTWEEAAAFQGHTRPVFALAFRHDGKELLTGSGSMEHPGEAIFWKFPGGKARLTRPAPEGVWAAAYAPSGKVIALATGEVEICDSKGQTKKAFKHKHKVRDIAFSGDGAHLATLTASEVRWWDLRAAKSEILHRSPTDLSCLRMTPGDNYLAWGGADGVVRLWNLATAREQAAYRWEVGHVTSLAFASPGMTAATGGNARQGNVLVLWDFEL